MPKRIDPDERRQTIADAAVTSIARHGLEGAKLTRIAREAGVTTGSVTHYFEDKDEVLLAALEEVCRRLISKMEEPDARPWLDQFADVLPATPEALDEWRVWLAFWGRAAFVPALARVHRAYYDRIETSLARMIGDEGQKAKVVASAIIAAIDGLGTRICLEPERWPPERQRQTLATLLTPLLEGKELLHANAPAPAG